MPKYAVSFTYSRTVCFEYGIEIEAASDSRLFGFDFLTLGAILDSRNKPGGQNVMQ